VTQWMITQDTYWGPTGDRKYKSTTRLFPQVDGDWSSSGLAVQLNVNGF